MLSCSVLSNPLWLARLLCPWDSPGKNTEVGCHFLLQEIFPTQESNLRLLHCRQTVHHWATRHPFPLVTTLQMEYKLYGLTWTGGFYQRATKADPFHSREANSLRVPPHTLLGEPKMMKEQSHGAYLRPRPFSMAMLRISRTKEGRGLIPLGLYTLYQSLCKDLKSFSGHRVVYKGYRSSNCIS